MLTLHIVDADADADYDPSENGGDPSSSQNGSLADACEEGLAADNVDDLKAVFTQNGTPRALSEANRLWNYACPYEGCSARYNRPCRLEMHIRTHNNERPFACEFEGCGKAFPRKEHLSRHVESTHAGIRKYKCDWEDCDRQFATAAHLRRHKKAHEKQEMFRCRDYPPCNESFRKKSTLDAHIKSKHLMVKAFACDRIDETTGLPCTMAYSRERSLNLHIARVHSGNKYFCNICTPAESVDFDEGVMSPPNEPVGFPTYSALQAHVTEIHPPICKACNKKFTTKGGLKAHIELAHEPPPGGNPTFACPEPGCDRRFTRRGNLSVHVQSVHQKVKRFICGEFDLSKSNIPQIQDWAGSSGCGQAFGAKCSLEQHVQTQHLGIKLTRKHIRETKKQEKRKAPSALSMLTGVGYGEDRQITCLAPGCDYRFFRDYELRLHLRGAPHSYSDQQITEMITERDALQGGQFWIGGVDDANEQRQYDPSEGFDPCIDPALQGFQNHANEGNMLEHSYGNGVVGYVTPYDEYDSSEKAALNNEDRELLEPVEREVYGGVSWNGAF